MSFGQRTPESLLPRSDSRNPATTCKGLTSNGRPCRRALAQSPSTSPSVSPAKTNGVVAVLDGSGGQSLAAFYCWQHKDQAAGLAAISDQTKLMTVQERTSIDTLVDRIGVVNLDEDVKPKRRKHRHRHHNEQTLKKRDTLPSGWHELPTPLMSIPSTFVDQKSSTSNNIGRSNLKASVFCCLRVDDGDLPPPRAHINKSRPAQPVMVELAETSSRPQYSHQPNTSTESRPGLPSIPTRKPVPSPASANLYPKLPSLLQTPTNSSTPWPSTTQTQTQTYLSLIPPNLSPTTTSCLLSELSKPISPADESGYIYIFWLTPDTELSKPDDETASSLMDNDPISSPDQTRRTDDALYRYASQRRPSQPQQKRKILLKIGRAANVHRRLSQWTKQCDQNITLIRYYPYNPAPVNPASATPRQVPRAHRVERLIHIEMEDGRAQNGACEACGREHREWFEVEASRKGLKGVDEVVRRWVAWGERLR